MGEWGGWWCDGGGEGEGVVKMGEGERSVVFNYSFMFILYLCYKIWYGSGWVCVIFGLVSVYSVGFNMSLCNFILF